MNREFRKYGRFTKNHTQVMYPANVYKFTTDKHNFIKLHFTTNVNSQDSHELTSLQSDAK